MKKLLILFLILLHSIYSIDVGNDGSLNHAIEIKIPQALIAPQLSVSYNSNGGNSYLGLGFQLNGLMAITRINHGEGIQYQGSDTYEGWQDLLHGQLEKVISIEKQAVGQLRGGCTQPLAFSSKEMTLFKTFK